jgi:hypothetical protein
MQLTQSIIPPVAAIQKISVLDHSTVTDKFKRLKKRSRAAGNELIQPHDRTHGARKFMQKSPYTAPTSLSVHHNLRAEIY